MLARNPSLFRLVGDASGWVKIKDIHKALMEEGLFAGLTPNAIEQHLLLFRPEGFEVSQGRVRVLPVLRAPGIFEYKVVTPPEVLFIPLRPRALHHADASGLSPAGSSGWITLFSAKREAVLYGKRFHNKPVLCKVNALEASQGGVKFRYAGASLYLVGEKIGRNWLVLPQIPKETEARAHKDTPLREKSLEKAGSVDKTFKKPGSFFPSRSAFGELFPKAGRNQKRPKGKSVGRCRQTDRKRRKK